jgi:anti-sigma-K factor RskA
LNIQNYISTGILEAYVSGTLSDQERSEVEKNLTLYPELRTELARIEEVQEKLLMQASMQPRAAVKEALWKQLDIQQASHKIHSPDSDTHQINWWQYAAAASILLAIVSSIMAYMYWDKWQHAEDNLSKVLAQNEKIAQDYHQASEQLDKVEMDLKIVNNPSFKRVVMKGTKNAPSAQAYVYWNAHTNELYVHVQTMQKLPRHRQYQLWAMVKGKPVSAGVFDADFSGLIKMKHVDGAPDAFAVTIEPHGGSQTPSLESMQVMGAV